jgi:hypothetical protein
LPVLGEGIDMAAAIERIRPRGAPTGSVSAGAVPPAGGRRRGRSRPPRA